MPGLRRTGSRIGAIACMACLLAMQVACAADGSGRQPAGSLEPTSSVSATDVPGSVPVPGGTPLEPTPETPATPEPADNTLRSWYYTPNAGHRVPVVPADAAALLGAHGGRYVGPDPSKVYLTFDRGYENGNTPEILDALARNGVHATFFVTASYIRANPALVRRMADEGHVIGNHTSTHPSLPSVARDAAAFAEELAATERAFAETTGRSLDPVMRPPMGEYSALSLWRTQQLGYTSVFWGFAHRDWLTDDQPPVDVTIDRILSGSHPGAIYLLHGVSTSDTQALDEAIAGLRAQGYGFGTL